MQFHRSCDQTKTQLNRKSSDPSESELAVRTMLIFTRENKIVHYFYCVGDASASKGWTIMYLIGGDCGKIFSLQEFVFATKSFVSILFHQLAIYFFAFCRYARCLFLLQTLCRNFVFVFANQPTPSPTPVQKYNGPSLNSYVYDSTWTADCSHYSCFWT